MLSLACHKKIDFERSEEIGKRDADYSAISVYVYSYFHIFRLILSYRNRQMHTHMRMTSDQKSSRHSFFLIPSYDSDMHEQAYMHSFIN